MRPGPVLFRLSVAVLAASQILSGCDKPRTKPEPEPVAAPAPNPVTPPTIPPVALNRAALLEALDQAASAFAATRKPPADDIAGRRFIVRQAFGCSGPGPAPQAGIAHWAWDPDHRTITITLKPADWIAEPPFNDPSNLWEAVEGVWISRPWMREEGCPAAQPLVPAPTPAPADQGAKQDTAAKVGAAPAPRPVKSVKLSPPPEVAGMAAVFAQGGSRSASTCSTRSWVWCSRASISAGATTSPCSR